MSAILAHPTTSPTSPTTHPTRTTSPAKPHRPAAPALPTPIPILPENFTLPDVLPPHILAILATLDPDDPDYLDTSAAVLALALDTISTPTPTTPPSAIAAIPTPSTKSPPSATAAIPTPSTKSPPSATPATPATPAPSPDGGRSPSLNGSAPGAAPSPSLNGSAPGAAPSPSLVGAHGVRPEPGDSSPRAALRDRAFELHCQGLSSPAISAQLGIPQRTIRRWIAATTDQLYASDLISHAHQLTTALEGLRLLLAAAWADHDTDAALHQSLIAQAFPHLTLPPSAIPATSATASARTARPPRIACRPDAYLRVALNVQRQIIRLLGLNRPLHITPPPTHHQTSAISATSPSARPPQSRSKQDYPRPSGREPALPPNVPTAQNPPSATSATSAIPHPLPSQGRGPGGEVRPPHRQPPLTHRQKRRLHTSPAPAT